MIFINFAIWAVSRNWSALFHFVVDARIHLLPEYHFGLYLSPVHYFDAVSTLIRSAARFYIDLFFKKIIDFFENEKSWSNFSIFF